MIEYSKYSDIKSLFLDELNVNSTFWGTSGYGGLTANNWSVAGAKATFSASSASDRSLWRLIPVYAGKTYRITFTVSDAGATPRFKLTAPDGSPVFSGTLNDYADYPVGTYVIDAPCIQTVMENLYLTGDNAAGSFSISYYSVKEMIYPAPYKILISHAGCWVHGTVLYGFNGNFLEKSIDFGDTWVAVGNKDFGAGVRGCFVSKDGILFVNNGVDGAGTDIWRSIDNGENWIKVMTTFGGHVRLAWGFAQASNGTLFIGEYSVLVDCPYIWKSTDNGENWTRNDHFAADAHKHIHNVFIDPETQRLYVSAGEVGSTFEYSDDEGDHWTATFGAYNKGFVSVTSIAGAIFLGSDWSADLNYIHKTTNDTVLINSFKSAQVYNYEWVEVIAVHNENTLFGMFVNLAEPLAGSCLVKSIDGGNTWTVIMRLRTTQLGFYFPVCDYRHRIPSEFGYLIVNSSHFGLIRIAV